MKTAVEARRGTQVVWRAELEGRGGPIGTGAGLVFATVLGHGGLGKLDLRGEPGSAVTALDGATGAPRWTLAVDATDWAVITAIAATADGAIVGGTFSGTLRVDKRVVSSAGKTDGFVARITAAGQVAWLVRVGGPGADAVQGVAASHDGSLIALAGTFAPGADVLGLPLTPANERSAFGDGFVAVLDPAGAPRWAQSFGGQEDESVAGVAIDARNRIAVAATVRDTVHVVGMDLVARGPADGMVAWWLPDGGGGTAVLLGGDDFDGLRAIAAAGDHVIAGGFFSGRLSLGPRTFTAGGGDDAFLVELDGAHGAIARAWPLTGDGREELTALAALPGGFAAGVAYTASAVLDGAALAAPADPMAGAAIVVRPLR
ncbi:MAG TPA: hypothetical protein VGC42_09155 [Kofleriaceae bacterium]